MTNQRRIGAAILLLVFHISPSTPAKSPAKSPASPVHEVFEVINEQSRIDDRRIQASPGPGILPYGNPLAGNSQHNAKLHAQNQQAMFNAEKVRQHRAQLQRLNKGPTQTDSYMRAYHESQESHQLALEQQQSNQKEKKPSTSRAYTATRSSTRPAPVTRTLKRQRTVKRTRGPSHADIDLAKIMQEESVSQDKNRNHRSYGSVEYQYVQPQKYKTVYVTAGPTYDQGVTIKPNGNNGVASMESNEEETQLFTHAVPSETQYEYVFPKQYSQMQQYESAQDIASLNALLKREPDDQLSELNTLIQSDKQTNELETPLDLYFYLKDPSLAQHYANSMYAQIPEYTSALPEVKDHIPITEEVNDIEDPNKSVKAPFTPQPTQVTTTTEDLTTNNINYYSVESTVVTNTERKPSYEALKYERPQKLYSQDGSQRYLHHNIKHEGVQHLNEDGSGVSAYGDDNVSISVKINRNRRSVETLETLETDPFLIPDNYTATIEINETIAKPEAFTRHRLNFNSYNPNTQTFANDDFDDEGYYDDTVTQYDDDDYNLEYDEPNFKYGTRIPNHKLSTNSQIRSPHQDLIGSHTELYGYKPHSHHFTNPSDFSTSYGVPEHIYKLPHDISSVIESLEPVYMLTESQLKSLVGHHNLNIQHLDVFQWQNKMKTKRPHRLRKYRKKHQGRFPSSVKKNLQKLHKLKLL